MPNRASAALAEFLGVFALTFLGILSISGGAIAGQEGGPTLTGVALAHGITIFVMVAALGAVSGAHFNPAVTFGFVATRRMDPVTGLVYWAAQIAGATAAALLLAGVVGAARVSQGTPDLSFAVPVGLGILLETVATFFLVLVVFGTAVDERAPRGVYPLAIGLVIAADILAIGPLTGGAMNPARVLGPAIASGHWNNHFVYWLGPLVGGALGALVAHHGLLTRAPSPEVAEHGGPAPSEKRR